MAKYEGVDMKKYLLKRGWVLEPNEDVWFDVVDCSLGAEKDGDYDLYIKDDYRIILSTLDNIKIYVRDDHSGGDEPFRCVFNGVIFDKQFADMVIKSVWVQ